MKEVKKCCPGPAGVGSIRVLPRELDVWYDFKGLFVHKPSPEGLPGESFCGVLFIPESF